ncbi:MAG TPA: sigma-70 family RNA polymerase sigma factor [Chitinophagales bacterium]|jgi:RNA polymerase sigma-70 factor (ECF subfamily)|nr:sigma-70 family RNA polymerase sigma factor [Chitinophagales bacterium]HPA35937.1 sigma-70 family RNA polymerase sigma factor [Chitinophagales bacterium]HPW86658.1 sigma-70 family RNA polymerase sigma factor [Chitinophagales bacterium]HQO31532.1 sigma-70 family RNA polymerase sigma factor [Chitinophagales bacterium]HQO90255.1 sigma-70 family RNA polymerase sigma factor [Chitinophagales bacterium]
MHPIVQTDHELIQRYVNGDENALATLLKKHQRKIFTFIFMRVKDRALAEDLFQDTFYKVIDCLHQGKYNEEGKFLPWVMMIANNLCMDHFRRNKRMPVFVDSDGKDFSGLLKLSEESKEDKIIREQNALQVREMINLLPADQKEVLILRHYADLSFKEIAEMTGTNINTALGRMRYALLNLRKMMGNQVIVQ